MHPAGWLKLGRADPAFASTPGALERNPALTTARKVDWISYTTSGNRVNAGLRCQSQ
jgi:hypothetical protein